MLTCCQELVSYHYNTKPLTEMLATWYHLGMIKVHAQRWKLLKGLELGRSLTNREIAEVIGVSTNALSRWFSGDVTRFDADVLDALCRYFDCRVGDLLEYVPDEEPEQG